MDYNGKWERGGGGQFRAEKVDSGGNNSWDVRFGKYRDYSIRSFRAMIHAGSSSTGSTFQWQAPRRGDTKMSPLVDF